MEFQSGVRELEPNIAAIMNVGRAQRTNPFVSGKYFYPLSIATYGAEEVMEALDSMCSFRTTMWEKTRIFEEAFGDLFGGEAVMVNSGSSADLLIAFSMRKESGGPLEIGDEVLCPAVTWPTQLWSLVMAGFKVRLVDIDPATFNMLPNTIANAISKDTRAISLVHLMGNPANAPLIKNTCQLNNQILLEDCCESLGATIDDKAVGTFGFAASFSFFFSHHITTMEGGMILTKNKDLAEEFRLLRAHGWTRNLKQGYAGKGSVDARYTFASWGFNVRPTELQAGFGMAQLKKINEFESYRIENAEALLTYLSRYEYLSFMDVATNARCVWFAFPITVACEAPFSRDELTAHLEGAGIETRPVVAGNLALHPAITKFQEQISCSELPGANFIHFNSFYIGIHPFSASEELSRVAAAFENFMQPFART